MLWYLRYLNLAGCDYMVASEMPPWYDIPPLYAITPKISWYEIDSVIFPNYQSHPS